MMDERMQQRAIGITESAISQHMKVLKEAGLVYGNATVIIYITFRNRKLLTN